MRTISFAVGLMFFLLCAFKTHSQSKTPAAFLPGIPSPPKTVQEALKRCPQEEDTLAQRFLREAQRSAGMDREMLQDDSLIIASMKRQPPIASTEMSEYKGLQQQLEQWKEDLPQLLVRATAKTSNEFLQSIQTIGEQLDNTIKHCPKVGPSKSPTYDSACVAMAEERAKFNRQHEAQVFLSEVGNNWTSIDSSSRSIQLLDNRFTQFLSKTKNQQLAYRLKLLRNELWVLIEQILKNVAATTQLAASFSK